MSHTDIFAEFRAIQKEDLGKVMESTFQKATAAIAASKKTRELIIPARSEGHVLLREGTIHRVYK